MLPRWLAGWDQRSRARYILDHPLGNVELIPAWFVNIGFTCIANILEGVKTPLTSRGVQEVFDVASEQLRLLAHVVELL